jgi:hypothetical protein
VRDRRRLQRAYLQNADGMVHSNDSLKTDDEEEEDDDDDDDDIDDIF